MVKILLITQCSSINTAFHNLHIKMPLDILKHTHIADALEVLRKHAQKKETSASIHMIFVDMEANTKEQLQGIKDILSIFPHIPLIVFAANTTFINNDDATNYDFLGQNSSPQCFAELCLRAGAYDFFLKPIPKKLLELTVQHTLSHGKRRNPNTFGLSLQRNNLIGSSHALTIALERLQEACLSTVNVLLLGESGVGKELFAKILHENSPRAEENLITVDCAALAENLIESQLFGHVRGAFTGANTHQEGLLRTAHLSTLFLDEVGELPLTMQKTFLRALEVKRFRPLGSIEEISSDFRLVAATNKDPATLEKNGLFRADLLYRLQGMTIRIPPLRQRKEDIIPLANHCIQQFCKKHMQPIKALSLNCIEALQSYTWPGNVRELFHSIERACLAAKDEEILFPVHLPTYIRLALTEERQRNTKAVKTEYDAAMPYLCNDNTKNLPSLKLWKQQAELHYVHKILEQTKGDIRKSAQLAGVSRGHFYELVKKHGLY